MIKRWLLLSLLAVLLTVALFPVEIFVYAAKCYLAKHLTFDEVGWHRGKLHVTAGRGKSIAFSKATFSPITKTIKVYGLVVEHQRERTSFQRGVLPGVACIEVCDGMLFLEGNQEPIHFDFHEKMFHRQHVGRLVLQLDAHPLETFFSISKGELQIASHFSDHACADVYQAIDYLYGERLGFWHVIDGKIDGRIAARFGGGRCTHLGGRLHVSNLRARNPELTLRCCIDTFDAQFEYDQEYPKSWNGDFSLEGGKLALEEEYWRGLWDIDALNSMITVRGGEVESSSLRGCLMGMEGEIDLDWKNPTTPMRLAFNGYSKEMVSLIPESLRERFSLAFPDDFFELDATIARHRNGLELLGNLTCDDQALKFGCQFGGGVERPAELSVEEVEKTDFVHQLKSQFCLSKKRLGWFEGKGVSLGKFFSPFLFGNVAPLTLEGVIDVEGTFDENYLVLFYQGEQISLDAPKFNFLTDVSPNVDETRAVHYVNLKNGEHVGYLPIRGGAHYQKNFDLLFEDVEGSIQFKNGQIHISDLHTHWQELLFDGELDMAIHTLTDVELLLRASVDQGSLMVGSRFLSHFPFSTFDALPLLGTFSTDEISFQFHNGKVQQGSIQGDAHFALAPLQNVTTQFAYTLPEKSLSLTHSKGELSVREHPCTFAAPYLSLTPEKMEMQLALNRGEVELFDVDLLFDRVKDQITISGDGVDIKGFGDGGEYHFPQIRCGAWEAECLAVKAPKHISIEALHLTHPEKGELEFVGVFDRARNMLTGNFDALEIELSPLVGSSAWAPKGHLSGRGEVDCSLSTSYANFTLSSTGLEFCGLPFEEGNDIEFTYSTDYGLVVEGLELLGLYHLGALHYNPDAHKLSFEDFDFSLPPETLPSVIELAERLFPGKIHPAVLDTIKALKQEELFEGRLVIDVNPESLWVTLHLKDGPYHFLNREWNIQDFVFSYTPEDVRMRAVSLFRGHPYNLLLKADRLTMQHGTLSLLDADDLLDAHFTIDPEQGWKIDRVEGSCLGINAHLNSVETEHDDLITLTGELQVNPMHLPSGLKRYSIGGDYHFGGNFTFAKQDLSDYTFEGTLHGNGCTFNRVELAQLTSNCNFSRSALTVSNLAIEDWSGRLFLDQAHLSLEENLPFHLSHLAIQDFRLSRLSSDWTRRSRGDRPIFRSLCIPAFELTTFTGELLNQASYSGEGALRFTNFPKKTLFSNLMMIPAEITARIGLDLTNFIPARGSISYIIEDAKINILDFDDVYSDGKRSRFYLAENTPATIDFQGNINMNIKMKQYNLLMKLAEFFTVSVKGNILHPTYMFTSSDQNL